MSEEFARVIVILWYLFFLGGVQCWAELRFVVQLSGKTTKPATYLFYIVVSRLTAALCFWMQVPAYDILFMLALLFLFSVKFIRLSPSNAILSCAIVFVLGTFFEGFLEVLMNPIASTFRAPNLLTAIAIQLLVSLLLLAGLLAAYSFIAHRYPVGQGAVSPSNLFTLLPCALIVWAVRSVMEPGGGSYARGRRQRQCWCCLPGWACRSLPFSPSLPRITRPPN